MDINNIVTLISTLGFPIVVCLVLGWFIYKIYKKSEQREDALRAEIKENQEINSKAVSTLALYAERLGVVEQDVKEIKEILIEHR